MPTLSRTHLLSFIFAAGILATLHMGLRFALVDQQAMLPGILHLSDPSLYSRDFGYSSGLTYGPRFYAFHMMGFLGGLLGHELATVVVVLLINGLVLYMTYRVAEQLFQGSRLAPIFAVVLVGVLGSAIIPLHPIITPEWDPRAMGMPFAFACLWAILRNRPMVAAIIAAVGSLIHPLLLINTAVIAFGGFGIGKLLDLTSAPRADRTRIFRDILWLIAAGLVFAIATYLTWILPYSVSAVSDNRLFEILRFRTPRSYELLKFWGIRGFIHLGIFIAGVAFAWTWWVRERVSEKHLANRVAGLIAMTLIMLAGAVIFVEFIPIRAWLMADASSGIYAARWLGLLLIARSAAVLIENTSAIREGAWSGAAMLVSGSGLALPALSLFGHLIEVLRRRLVRWMDATALVIVMISGLVVAGFLLAAFGSPQDSFGLVLLGAFALPFVIFPQKPARALIPAIVAIILFAFAVGMRGRIVSERLNRITSFFTQVISLDDARFMPGIGEDLGALDDVSKFVRNNTPKDALLAAPPMASRIKLVSRRSVVVNYKAMPGSAEGMLEWRRRLDFCYGETTGTGAEALEDFENGWRNVSIEKLTEIRRRYGPEYAILYASTRAGLSLPTLYSNSRYRLVDLRPLDQPPSQDNTP